MVDEILNYKETEIYKKIKNARVINFKKLLHSYELKRLSEIFNNNEEERG